MKRRLLKSVVLLMLSFAYASTASAASLRSLPRKLVGILRRKHKAKAEMALKLQELPITARLMPDYPQVATTSREMDARLLAEFEAKFPLLSLVEPQMGIFWPGPFVPQSALTLKPGWTWLQDSVDYACTTGTSSCTMQTYWPLPLTSGSVRIAIALTDTGGKISSATLGGSSLSLCPSSACYIYNSTLGWSLDAAYGINVGGTGIESLVVNMTSNTTSVFLIAAIELLPPSGYTASYDTVGTYSSASCNPCSGVGLTLSETDAVVEWRETTIAYTTPWAAWGSPATSPWMTDFEGTGYYLNAPPGSMSAPSVALSSAGAWVVTALAFKSTANTFTTSAPQYLENYTFTSTALTCSPTCSMTIPSTTSGNLIYLEVGTLSGAYNLSSFSIGATAGTVPSGCESSVTSPAADYQSCGYLLSAPSGATSANITMSGTATTYAEAFEVAKGGGSWALDTSGSASNSASYTPQGVALTLSGTNDAVFQCITAYGGYGATTLDPLPSTGVNGAMYFTDAGGCGLLLNTVNGAAPYYTFQNGYVSAVTGMAFK
jgi:hypothetical protein